MKAMIIEEFGDTDVFREAERPVPELKAGEVLIRVAATSVNPVDCLIRGAGPGFSPALPAILHGDVAGTVVKTAPGVTKFAPGDEVYGYAGGVGTRGGALAEFMAAEAALLARKPASLSMEAAAALPLVTVTAWNALHRRAPVGPGQKVLIRGATGGVAHVAIQLAKAAGAQVSVIASSADKVQAAKGLGADDAIDYHTTPLSDLVARQTGGEGFDLVFDTVGGGSLPESFEAARHGGHVVTTVALGPVDMTMAHLRALSVHVVFVPLPLLGAMSTESHGLILAEAAKLVDDGRLRPLLHPQSFAIRDVAKAHELQESGRAVGKIVLGWN